MTRRSYILLACLILLSAVALYLQGKNVPLFSRSDNYSTSLPQRFQSINKVYEITELGTEYFPERLIDPEQRLGVYAKNLQRWTDFNERNLGIDLQIMVVKLKPGDIGEQAAEIFKIREVSKQAPTGGILILVEPEQRLAKIEVSYELEGILTDSQVGYIAKQQLAPYAAYGTLGMALGDTIHYLRNEILLAAIQGKIAFKPEYKETQEFQESYALFSGGAGGQSEIEHFDFDRDFKQRLSETEAKLYAASSDPIESARALMRVYRDVIGDPELELFTDGSKVQRRMGPVAMFEYRTRYREMRNSQPFTALTEGNYAVVTSHNPSRGFVPVLLKKERDLWRVDLAETWKNLFYKGDGSYFLRNSNTPYHFGLSQFGEASAYDVAAIPIREKKIEERITELQQYDTALSHFLLGEIYFRNAFHALEGLKHYELAVQKAPKYPYYAEKLAERYLYAHFTDAAIPLLKEQGRVALLKLAEAYAQIRDYSMVEKTAGKVLESNPYSTYAMHWIIWSLEKQKRSREAKKVKAQLEALLHDPSKKSNFVWLTFSPARPVFDASTTVNVNGEKIHGHSAFAVTMTNHSNRTVKINSLVFRSRGDRQLSGLGDIKHYFHYNNDNFQLSADESITYEKVWGFTVPIEDRYMTYDFELCWQGIGDKQQCEVQRLHLGAKENL